MSRIKRVSRQLFLFSPAHIRNGQENIEGEKWPKPDKRKVPPIFLHDMHDMNLLLEISVSSEFNVQSVRVCNEYSKLFFETRSDYKKAMKYLDNKKVSFHTYGLPEKKKLKVVIKGLPKDTDVKSLLYYLKSVNIPVLRTHAMHTNPEKNCPLLVLAVVPHTPEGKKILSLTEIMGHKVKFERLQLKVTQCHRCQKFHHAQRYCHAKIRCVKCAGEHWSKKCTKKPKDPPKCANCGSDHTANYKGCEHFMKACKALATRDLKPHEMRRSSVSDLILQVGGGSDDDDDENYPSLSDLDDDGPFIF